MFESGIGKWYCNKVCVGCIELFKDVPLSLPEGYFLIKMIMKVIHYSVNPSNVLLSRAAFDLCHKLLLKRLYNRDMVSQQWIFY